ncbi:dolichol-phosphate mannosyltransferase [Pedobacter steynii]|uniref:Dolichol-phosphate mannosyltransferase n=1 Tax=Pedobacter steynii TaxID=430522 RepID=A0A1H0J7J4_9SPHI|nr:glycosyltransferase family 2 protein [Pedobacter steynii]NQX43052.1 glycosyltransferase [Pedobacter steynii]SDO39582.1 dolichol-phosphate mannosyltransferase [Pedobacter steynii]
MKICIIVPCFNEEDNITPFYDVLKSTVEKYNHQILFVNDGSTDKTLERIKGLAKMDSCIHFLSFSRNFGHQNALKAGYDYADADCVICIDADLQQPPSVIDQLIQKWQEGYEVVYTIRIDGNDVSPLKKITALLFYKFLNYISKIELKANAADFRLIDRKVLKAVKSFNEQNIFFRGLIAWVGFKQFGLEYKVEQRLHGKSKYPFRKMLSLSLSGVTSFSISPLRVASVIGFCFSGLSFVYGFYALYLHLYTQHTIPGWTSMIMSFLFITGLQFIMMGIIGEYLGKGLMEAKGRPNYLISEDSFSERTPFTEVRTAIEHQVDSHFLM